MSEQAEIPDIKKTTLSESKEHEFVISITSCSSSLPPCKKYHEENKGEKVVN